MELALEQTGQPADDVKEYSFNPCSNGACA
jgi:hypothetical protein